MGLVLVPHGFSFSSQWTHGLFFPEPFLLQGYLWASGLLKSVLDMDTDLTVTSDDVITTLETVAVLLIALDWIFVFLWSMAVTLTETTWEAAFPPGLGCPEFGGVVPLSSDTTWFPPSILDITLSSPCVLPIELFPTHCDADPTGIALSLPFGLAMVPWLFICRKQFKFPSLF